MSTVSDIIADIRLEMTDEQSTRWTDAQAIRVIGKAARRINAILHRNDIEAGRAYYDFTLLTGETSVYLPSDFMTVYGLYRQDTHKKLNHYTTDEWEQIYSAYECTAFAVNSVDDSLVIGGAPIADVSMRLYYWPNIDTTAYTTSTIVPWSGRFDDLIAEYAALRLKNIDEMDATFDLQLLQDMENNVLSVFSTLEPETVQRRGWLV